MEKSNSFRVAITSDAHIGKKVPEGKLDRLARFKATFEAMLATRPDIIGYCGDVTDLGIPEQAREAAAIFNLAKQKDIPVILLLGNHDHWGYKFNAHYGEELKRILQEEGGVTLLDGQALHFEKNGRRIGITGVEGYSEHSDEEDGEVAYYDMQASYGSRIVEDEAEKLRRGLRHLRGEKNIVMLHYPPGENENQLATIAGEPKHLQHDGYLGSTRNAQAIVEHNQESEYKVNAVFHGHVDSGSPKGTLEDGVDVYNVSVIAREKRNLPLFEVIEL